MKKVRHKIAYNETGLFKVNQVSERYFYKYYEEQSGPYIKALFQSSYQICNIYTEKNTVLSAYKKLNGKEATNLVILDHENKYIPLKIRDIICDKIIYNDKFNCHGFTFLDAQFWFELDNKTVDLIIQENNYTACRFDELDENGIGLYYNKKNQLIHSARLVNGNLLSKFGINHKLTKGQEDLLNKYKQIDQNNTRYFNR